ncbi:MAG: sigma-54-dependent Fis family transcriptional regulator [Phycisphaerae bacterium]|nr:sigma-54-dependent Fis family transcriptional regulator [Gemmatimonadaceae bacterium]
MTSSSLLSSNRPSLPPVASSTQLGAGRILVAEDDGALRELLVELLTDAGYSVVAVGSGSEALPRIRGANPPEVVLTDLVMPGLGGEALLAMVQREHAHIPVVVMTAFGSIDSAVQLVRAGAFDYVTKPVATSALLQSLARGVAEARAQRVESDAATTAARVQFTGIVAESTEMKQLLAVVQRVGAVPHPVLLTGESGTGKEVLAHAIHGVSGRSAFVAVNCGAVPANLIESELFGHEKGAFTGADREKVGLFEAADGGTLFLDEIGELPLALQPALLRVLESGEARRIGSTRTRKFDVRVIAATNRDLEGETRTGRFREDLFWRLNVLHLDVPPLRDRPADVSALATRFLKESGSTHSLDASAESLMLAYAWPGNVRELRNTIQRAATFARSEIITVADLPPRLRAANQAASLVAKASTEQLPLHAVERAYVLEVLRQTAGNKSRASEILGLDRKTLYRKLAEYASEQEVEDALDDPSATDNLQDRPRKSADGVVRES